MIDTANCRNVDFEQVLRIARRHGDLVVTQAYSNFTNWQDLGEAAQNVW